MICTVAQIAMVVWELDSKDAGTEIGLCNTFFFGSDPESELPKFRKWIRSRSSLNRIFSAKVPSKLSADIHQWTKLEFIEVMREMLRISDSSMHAPVEAGASL